MGRTGEGGFALLPAFFLSLLVFGNIGVENKICMNFFPRRGPSSGKIWFFWKQSPPISKLHKTRLPYPAFLVHSYKVKKLFKNS